MWARAAEIPLLATPRFVVRFATTTVTHLRTEGTSSGYPDEVSNEHYFSESPMSEGPEIERAVHLRAHEYSVVTQHGVFAHDKVDKGTAVLLDKVPEPQLAPEDLAVDVGCGWGPVTLALAHEAHGAEVWGVDVNERARELTAKNLERASLAGHVFSPDEAAVALGGRTVKLIWSNPPVRIGKEALHELLVTWLDRLAPDGIAYLVVQKNLGADSLQRWLVAQGYGCDKHASAKGYRILAATAR